MAKKRRRRLSSAGKSKARWWLVMAAMCLALLPQMCDEPEPGGPADAEKVAELPKAAPGLVRSRPSRPDLRSSDYRYLHAYKLQLVEHLRAGGCAVDEPTQVGFELDLQSLRVFSVRVTPSSSCVSELLQGFRPTGLDSPRLDRRVNLSMLLER